jgi:protein-tyrosine phosphatase
MAPNDDALAKVHYLREFDLEADGDVDLADPYYGTRKDYEEVFDIIERSVGELHRRLQENL